MMSTWSQSEPWAIFVEHSLPRVAKSALKMDGAMIAGGDMMSESLRSLYKGKEAIDGYGGGDGQWEG